MIDYLVCIINNNAVEKISPPCSIEKMNELFYRYSTSGGLCLE